MYAQILESALCGVYVYDLRERKNLYINSQYTTLTGWSKEELDALSPDGFFELFHPDDREAVLAHMAEVRGPGGESGLELEYRFKARDGRWMWCWSRDTALERDAQGDVVRFIGSFVDITLRNEASEARVANEREVYKRQRLESLGLLAGGIAHDFNNLLTGILGSAELAQMSVPANSPAREDVDQILASASHCADLCRQLLAYAGKGKFIEQPLSLTELVLEVGRVLDLTLPNNVLIRYQLAENLPAVRGDATQLRQVVLNLLTNAAESISRQRGTVAVSIGLSTGTTQAGKEEFGMGELNSEPYVCLEVSDTGCGMDETTLTRIFDPFFTTKFSGRGLGLAAVLGIVRGHRGALRVYSDPGVGTTFRVLLPACEAAPRALYQAPSLSEGGPGSGTVLVIDDEEVVREVARRILERSGYEVLTCGDGREGLEAYRRYSSQIRVVVLDLMMPRMDGEATLRELRRLDPEVSVIMASGYNEQELTTRFAADGLAGFVQKPFGHGSLLGAVRTVCGEG